MNADSLDKAIAAILERGEPIDYEGLLRWPKPATDIDGFNAAQAALDAYSEAQLELERKRKEARSSALKDELRRVRESLDADVRRRRAKLAHLTSEELQEWLETTETPSDEKADVCEETFRRLKPNSHRDTDTKIPFLDERPELEAELDAGAWRIVSNHLEHFSTPLEKLLAIHSCVDWRPGLRAANYFDDAMGLHTAIQNCVKLLCLAAIHRSIYLRRDDWNAYLICAIHLAVSATSLRLLMSHLVFSACAERISATIAYVLYRVAAPAEMMAQLSHAAAFLDDEHTMERHYVGERVFGLANCREKLPAESREGYWWLRLGVEQTGEAHFYLENIARLIDIACLQTPDRVSAACEFARDFEGTYGSQEVRSAIEETIAPAVLFNLHILARVRLLRATLMILLDGPDSAANSNAFPRDPFDTGRIRFRASDNGFVVYSVGFDQIDSGGSSEFIGDCRFLGCLHSRIRTEDIVLKVTRRTGGAVSLVYS